MAKILLLAIAIATVGCVLRSSDWEKQGFNVKDGILEQQSDVSVTINTVCNTVNLTVSPYLYNGTVTSGYLKVGKGNSALSFIFYGRENTPQSQLNKYPIILWLNGGPGSSSQLGNFMELGPYWLQPGQSLTPYDVIKNNNSWVKQYNVIFVDQPVGTGLSYADPTYAGGAYVKSMDDVANDFYAALKELYQNTNGCFNKLGFLPSQDLIIFGESYAGKYAPAIGLKIKKEQQENNGFLTGLRGVAIGDGFTHPYKILSEVGEYAYNLGLLDYQERAKVEQMIMNATFQERSRSYRDLHDTFQNVLGYIVTKSGGVNVYDITKYAEYPTSILNEYFGDPTIKKLYSFNTELVFGSQGGNVYEALYEDFMKPETGLVSELLTRKVPVLIYNGQNDLIVETPGTFRWVEQLNFPDFEKFRDTLFTTWKTNGVISGYKKEAGYLELLTVNNAGHLVPMDQGVAALELARNFVKKCIGHTASQTQQQE